MIKYEVKKIDKLDDKEINLLYKELLNNKWHFMIINNNDINYILTKEKSIFKIDDVDEFIRLANKDIFYRTELVNNNEVSNKDDLNLFKKYINEYRNKIEKNLYGDKYLFGSIAVRTNNNEFITTIRGKEDLDEYTIVKKVNNSKHIVYVNGKKATLNAPLLDTLFKNRNVKVIVHVNHDYDETLPYYKYAFPGTVRDSIRNNQESFNIKYHGLFYLINDNGEIIKKEDDVNEVS